MSAAMSTQATPTIPAPPETATRWRAALRDLPREHGFEPLRVEGALPAGLAGTLWRTGPALFSSFGEPYRHWFDGDGAVSAVRLAGGRAEGAVRLVQSAGLVAERKAGKRLYAGYGTQAPGLRRFLPPGRRFKNAANTSMLVWGERVFALWEGGRPTEIAPADLATLGERDLDGAVVATFTAHPHAVAARGTIYNFGVRFGRQTVLDLYALGGDGRARRLGEVPLPFATSIHDFIVTDKHMVFFVSPVVASAAGILFGTKTLSDALAWKPELGTEIIVVPIDDPEAHVRFGVEAFYQWHFANAYERGGELVVDFVRYPDFASNAALGSLSGAAEGQLDAGTLWRATLDPAARRARFEERWAGRGEFPTVAPAVAGARHGVTWMATTSAAAAEAHRLPDGIARVDVERGEARVWLAGDAIVSEPVFAPRPGGAGEDDGWLLTLVYDAASDRSCVVVLDASDPSRGPLARAWFDHHVPPTFHGTFAPISAKSIS